MPQLVKNWLQRESPCQINPGHPASTDSAIKFINMYICKSDVYLVKQPKMLVHQSLITMSIVLQTQLLRETQF